MKSLKDQVAEVKAKGAADVAEVKSWKPGSPTPKMVKDSVNMATAVGSVKPGFAKKGVDVLPSMQKAITARLSRNDIGYQMSGKLNKLGNVHKAMVDRYKSFDLKKFTPK